MAFINGKSFGFLCPALVRRVITALAKVKPSNWLAAFESWYYNNSLQTHLSSELTHLNDSALKEYLQLLGDWRTELINCLEENNQKNKERALKNLKQNNRLLYDSLTGKREISIERLGQEVCKEMETLKGVFPILLSNLHGLSLIKKCGVHFDTIFVEEGHQLDAGILESFRGSASQVIGFF